MKRIHPDATLTTVRIRSSVVCRLVATEYGEIKSLCVYPPLTIAWTQLKPESGVCVWCVCTCVHVCVTFYIMYGILYCHSLLTELFHLLRYTSDNETVMSLIPAAAPDHVITWGRINEGSGEELIYELKMEVCICLCMFCSVFLYVRLYVCVPVC